MESRQSRSFFTNFSFTQWNFGHHGASLPTFLSHDGISAITEPFYQLFFHTMEFQLSRSLSQTFTNSFSRWNSQDTQFWGRLFSYTSQRVSQRVFTWSSLCTEKSTIFLIVTSWNFLREVSNAKMWISKFRFEIECIIKM
jgi:hypothetical protein